MKQLGINRHGAGEPGLLTPGWNARWLLVVDLAGQSSAVFDAAQRRAHERRSMSKK